MYHEISSAFPYTSHYLDIADTRIHYIEEGKGNPVIFLHSVPAWSYTWRNIIPYLAHESRCIAPDLVGFGRSGKSGQAYRIFDHIHYIERFINKMNFNNITLVMHGWGSVIGFHLAMKYPERIKGLAFFEAHLRPQMDNALLSLPEQELKDNLHPDHYEAIVNTNYYITQILPQCIMRPLNSEEMDYYREPFKQAGDGQPIWQYLEDLHLNHGKSDVTQLIQDYSLKLCRSMIPKLMLYAVPGFITTIETVQWAKQHFPNLTLVDIGESLHYPQETNPDIVGHELYKWHMNL